LLAIGVSSDTAAADSEGLEHHVSEETLAALTRLTESLTKDR
jgi:DtxR family manganese transport transcriptional regulator